MSKKSNPVVLHRLKVTVRPVGVETRLFRYAAKKTDKNYVGVKPTMDMEIGGPVYRLDSRVPIDVIGRVLSDFRDGVMISRAIYYLAADEKEAVKKLRKETDFAVRYMKMEADKLLEAWVNRHKR